MTQLRKSDAQLDAEAGEPREGGLHQHICGIKGCRDHSLPHLIPTHRQLSAAELSIQRLHVRDGESGLGPPFSQPFARFLDGSYGFVFPWSAGVKSLRNDCRRSHSEHWAREEWRGSLCARLVHLVVREAWSFERACQELVVTPERTERTLLRAFRRIEERLAEIQSRETEAVKSSEGRHDWMAPEHVHQSVPGLHAAHPDAGGCVQCWRRGAVA